MRRLFFIILLLPTLIACGMKADPKPHTTLTIPEPAWVVVKLEKEGVVFENPSEYSVVIQKAVSEVGGFSIPMYFKITTLEPNGSFLDNETKENVQYLYRLRTRHKDHEVYSEGISHTVSYKSTISIEDIKKEIKNGILCLEITPSSATNRFDVFLNGKLSIANESLCYKLPPVSKVLLAVVPYSEAGHPGQAYSETLEQDLSKILLPPQNTRVIQRENITVLSWDLVPMAESYRISVEGESYSVDATLFNYTEKIDKCIMFRLESIGKDGNVSAPIDIQVCP